jgi:hypothetical protein
MLAFRSVVSVLLRALGDCSLHPQGRPCARPPAAAVLGRRIPLRLRPVVIAGANRRMPHGRRHTKETPMARFTNREVKRADSYGNA